MGLISSCSRVLISILFLFCASHKCFVKSLEARQTALLTVDASPNLGQRIPDHLFGVFFEEINHAGAGGLWAELVSNRGFEAGGPNTPSNIDPWSVIGNESLIVVSTDRTSCFSRNKIALRMEVICDSEGSVPCPADGVGVYNPGYWGMNIEKGKTYKLVLYVRSLSSIDVTVSLTSSDGLQKLASAKIQADVSDVSNWTKVELPLKSVGTNRNSRLQLTTTKKGTIWFDQVSVMPTDTYKGHGFRKELLTMVADLKPRFLRFPGGCFVEGSWLRNAFRWKETVGPWEQRPGHFGDVWNYWTDDGLGYYEFLQLAEDLNTSPIWVVNNGVSHHDEVDTANILPFVQEILDSIEFARGSPLTKWGSLRAKMGHPLPFKLEYVAIGNEDCGKPKYLGNYMKFYDAIRAAYPDIKLISNCDGSSTPLDHPADLYEFHIYTTANDMFSQRNHFNNAPRKGPKAFVSEYAVWRSDAGAGSLLAALAEAAFLIGLERNSDAVEMASYAPLFVNTNNRGWMPDAIVFYSWQQYGTPSYWMQHFFQESPGAVFHPSKIQANFTSSLVASAITWKDSSCMHEQLKIKIVNFGNDVVKLKVSVVGLQNAINSYRSTKTVLTSSNVMDENSFAEPNKIVPVQCLLSNAGPLMEVTISPHSITSFNLATTSRIQSAGTSEI